MRLKTFVQSNFWQILTLVFEQFLKTFWAETQTNTKLIVVGGQTCWVLDFSLTKFLEFLQPN